MEAERNESHICLTYEQEVHALLCAAAANTENLLQYFAAQAEQETGEAKKLTQKCIEWKRDDLQRMRSLIPQALERRDAAKQQPSLESAAREIAREWYEAMKAADPHHFAEHEEDGGHDFPDTICEYTFEMFSNCPMVKHGLSILEQHLHSAAQPGWISVESGKLPEKAMDVLFHTTDAEGLVDSRIYVGWLDGDGKWYASNLREEYCVTGVTHWRELPEPPVAAQPEPEAPKEEKK